MLKLTEKGSRKNRLARNATDTSCLKKLEFEDELCIDDEIEIRKIAPSAIIPPLRKCKMLFPKH